MSVTVISPTTTDHRPDGPCGDGDDGKVTPSVTKALQLLEAFRETGPALGVSEIARLAGMPKSTAFRLLNHLEAGGYVERSGRLYVLGRRLFELGNAVQMCRPDGLRTIALPHLADLYVTTNKVVHLGVLDGTDVVYLEKICGLGTLKVDTVVGGRMPAACSALGKAMLAFSERGAIGRVLEGGLSRRTRYSVADPARFLGELRRANVERVAFDREENRLGLVCAAAPVLREGRAVAAVSVSGAATKFNTALVAGQVRRAADAISQALRQDAA